MTRLNRKRRSKRKNNDLGKILALALAFGISGTATSYAYFSAKAEATSNLKISTGNLDLNLERFNQQNLNTLNIEGLTPNLDNNIQNEKQSYFNIVNNGSLKEKIKVSMNFSNADFSQYIKGNLVFKDNNNQDISSTIDLRSFSNNNFVEILDKNKNPLILESGQSIKGVITLYLDNSIPYEYENTDFEFSITTKATQVNNKDWQ